LRARRHDLSRPVLSQLDARTRCGRDNAHIVVAHRTPRIDDSQRLLAAFLSRHYLIGKNAESQPALSAQDCLNAKNGIRKGLEIAVSETKSGQ